MAALLRRNGLAVQRTKRYLDMLRVVVGFRASSATFVGRIAGKSLENVDREIVRGLLQPLLDDLRLAIATIDA